MSMKGHFWTIAPTLRGLLRPPACPPSVDWSTNVADPKWGEVPIAGKFSDADSDTAVLILHGLGGNADGIYMRQAAAAAGAKGWASLRMGMRGSDGSGVDLYHGGLTADLRAALDSEELKRFETVYLVGHSLGGHMALKAASEGLPEQVKGIVAIGSPLDLGRGSKVLDEPQRKVYREYVLRELRESYEDIAAKKRHITPVERIRLVRSIREYDALTVVPRFGFDDVEDYYRNASVAGQLSRIEVPSLLIASNFDPMIPRAVVEPVIKGDTGNFEVHWVNDGGHVYFPPYLKLGYSDQPGVAAQAMGWLSNR